MSFKSNLYLKSGWNLISFYQREIDFKSITKYENILEIKNSDKSYNKLLPIELNTLKEFVINSGYWVKTDKEIIIELSGDNNKKTVDYELTKGWNLLSYPFKLDTNIDEIIILKFYK